MLAGVCSSKTVLKTGFSAILAVGAMLSAGWQSADAQTVPTSVRSGQGTKLAPDALEIIPSSPEPGETALGPVDLPLVAKYPDLAWKPNYAPVSETLIGKSKDVIFRNDVYSLEFAFKPVRMIQVNDKLVWYLLYRVRNVGGDLRPEPNKDNYGNEIFSDPQAVSSQWVRFFPTVVLNSINVKREYMDTINPAAKALIAAKEQVGQPIYDSIEMQQQKIPLSTEADNHEIWGVAMWEDIDPRTIFFSVRVKGLTNAQKLESRNGEIAYLQKTLVLHFSRPGDTVDQLEDTIRYGVPAIDNVERQKYVLDQYGLQERLDHLWIYR